MSPLFASMPRLLGLSYPTHDHEKHDFSDKIINAGTRLIFGASRSNLQPLARGGDAVTPPLILMRKTDAVRTDDLPNAEWNETNERGEGYGEREYAHFAAAQDWARKNCTRVG